ncbi:MAG: hypothetical protein FJ184_09175 [Gammaproteobacteria bacterium]|nr:hypothetical protein [Gammaproteobacteria bacterium]
MRNVLSSLRAKLKGRFVELVDVDLRWGITVEQAERGEVLPICLAEIDRSRPDRASATICRLNSAVYRTVLSAIVNSSCYNGEVSTKPGQLQPLVLE